MLFPVERACSTYFGIVFFAKRTDENAQVVNDVLPSLLLTNCIWRNVHGLSITEPDGVSLRLSNGTIFSLGTISPNFILISFWFSFSKKLFRKIWINFHELDRHQVKAFGIAHTGWWIDYCRWQRYLSATTVWSWHMGVSEYVCMCVYVCAIVYLLQNQYWQNRLPITQSGASID